MFRRLFSMGRDKKKVRRNRATRLTPLNVESLERREVMAVTSSVAAGLLTVTGDGADDPIAITCVAGGVKINGADPGTGAATCLSLSAISVDGGAGNDTIDLRGVTYPNFLSVADAIPLRVTINGGLGNDTIFGSNFSDIINSGDGADRVFGNSSLDQRDQLALGANCTDDSPDNLDTTVFNGSSTATLTKGQVCRLLRRADVASTSDRAIIVVVDRMGHILGVNVEPNVIGAGADQIPVGDLATLVFAIDGAVAEARTAAYFANQNTPLTSRTIRSLSQTTVLEREVNANPNVDNVDLNANGSAVDEANASTRRGPGTVAAIGRAGHFPPDIPFTPQVDLFDIEHTNRDSIINAGPDRIKGTADDIFLRSRFDADPGFIQPGQEIDAPESYGFQTGLMPFAQGRGFGTLPGGIPILGGGPNGLQVLGGIGVFFPGPNGFASFEQQFVAGAGQSTLGRLNSNLAMEAEYIALAAVGGFKGQIKRAIDTTAGTLASSQLAEIGRFVRSPSARIELVGISLEIIGPNPARIRTVDRFATQLFRANAVDTMFAAAGSNQQVLPNGDTLAAGEVVPEGLITRLPSGEFALTNYLVTPHASPIAGGPTAAEVESSIRQGVAEALGVRAAIRLPRNQRSVMVLSVTDNAGNVLGLFRMPDSTIFSIEVATSKARNTAYYASGDLVLPDQVDTDGADASPFNLGDGIADVPRGTAFTNRTFRFLALPFFPEGQNGANPGDFSICNDLARAITALSGATVTAQQACDGPNGQGGPENQGLLIPARYFDTVTDLVGAYTASVMGHHAFHPGTNFRDPNGFNLQSGIVFFPGSSALYRLDDPFQPLIGGYGISGDGVDQDDVVTDAGIRGQGACSQNVAGAMELQAPGALRADQFRVRGVRLPYVKFLRNPCG